MFENRDIDQIIAHGLEVSRIKKQLEDFKNGFPPLKLMGPATLNDGIATFSNLEKQKYVRFYDQKITELKIVKFVPASGAASRMFKSLQAFRNCNFAKDQVEQELSKDQSFDSAFHFFKYIEKFAFYEDIKNIMHRDGINIKEALQNKEYNLVLDYMLTSKGLNYNDKPKALIKFHRYPDFYRTALGEHLAEGALYACSGDGKVRIHVTLSPEYIEEVKDLLKKVLPYYEKTFKVKYDISLSIQDPSTDTIAVDKNNNFFREKEGSLVFRPGGHGALLSNLNKIKADLIFIKNIDNVVPDSLKDITIDYKKLLGGCLIDIQEQLFDYLDTLDYGDISDQMMNEISDFIELKLMIKLPDSLKFYDLVEKADYFFQLLNRPIRICGMVKNEGEPGGGPFWVKNEDDSISLQIVESSQIDHHNEKQRNIFQASTHFNPVDMLCSTIDFRGKKFNLHEFSDPKTGFISLKSKDGQELKALELPGLWNGAMAFWNTIFIEVPLITFNPVKIVNDLLRKEHQ